MRLVVTFDSDGTPASTEVYNGSSVDDMGSAMETYIATSLPANQAKQVRRWWAKAKTQTLNGLEPELRYIGTVGIDVWKVWQDFTS